MFAIRAMRERVNLTQQEVADALDIKRRRYGDWETERREINLKDAIRLADLFGCTLDELAGIGQPTLSTDETRLLAYYRDTDSRGKDAIMRNAIGESGVERKPEARAINDA